MIYAVWNMERPPSRESQTSHSRMIRCFSAQLFFYDLPTVYYSVHSAKLTWANTSEAPCKRGISHVCWPPGADGRTWFSSFSRIVICCLGVVICKSLKSRDCTFNYLRRADLAGTEDRITTSLSSRWPASAVGQSNLATDGGAVVSPVVQVTRRKCKFRFRKDKSASGRYLWPQPEQIPPTVSLAVSIRIRQPIPL